MSEIPFHVPYLTGDEDAYIAQVMAKGRFGGNGDFTKRAQRILEGDSGRRVLLTTSCTAALELAAMALDCGPGDEVIVPSYTFVSTASAFLRTGAKIVFAEVDRNTLMVGVEQLARCLTPATKAVVVVHYAGVIADVAGISNWCAAEGLTLVEDAAQAYGSSVDDVVAGTTGAFGTLSFHETKNIHCGLGGALYLTADRFDRVENMWERGTNRAKMFRGLVDKYSWVEPGSSFYPTELQAAFLTAQLEGAAENLRVRAALTAAYDERLADLEAQQRLTQQPREASLSWNHHAIVCVFPSFDVTERVRLGLKAADIHAYIGYVPLHSSPMGARLGYAADDLPVTEDVARRVLRLPLHHAMTVDDVHRVCDHIAALTEAS